MHFFSNVFIFLVNNQSLIKKFLRGIAFIFLVLTVQAQALMPLAEYKKLNNDKIPSTQLFVYDRCSGLILALLYAQKIHHYTPKAFEFLVNQGYVDFTVLTIELIKDNFVDQEGVSKQEIKNMQAQTEYYDEHVSKIVQSGRSIENDALLFGDNQICTQVLKSYKANHSEK